MKQPEKPDKKRIAKKKRKVKIDYWFRGGSRSTPPNAESQKQTTIKMQLNDWQNKILVRTDSETLKNKGLSRVSPQNFFITNPKKVCIFKVSYQPSLIYVSIYVSIKKDSKFDLLLAIPLHILSGFAYNGEILSSINAVRRYH